MGVNFFTQFDVVTSLLWCGCCQLAGVGVVDTIPGKLKWSASPTPSLSGQLIMANNSVDNIMMAL